MAKKISWRQAAEIMRVTGRTMRRWRERLEEHGYSGLVGGRKGKPIFRRVPMKTCEEVLRPYRETYFDSEYPALSREAKRGARHRLSI